MNIRETKDRNEFDRVIENHQNGHLLQSYGWGQLKSNGWQPIYLIVEDGNKPIGGMLLLKRRVPFINKTMLYCPRGPVIDFNNTDLLVYTMRELRKIAKEHRAVYLKIDPEIDIENKQVIDLLKSVGFVQRNNISNNKGVQPKFTYRLDISGDLDQVLKNFHSKTRYNIRLAGRKGVNVFKGDRQDLEEFHRLMKLTGQRDNFVIRPLEYFQRMYDAFHPAGYLELFLAEYKEQIIAGAVCIKYGHKCWYLYGASSNAHRNVMATYLLQWQMINWAKEHGCRLYDFGGVSGYEDKDSPLYGVYRFKKGFSGEVVEFIGEFDYPINKILYITLENGISLLRKLSSMVYKLRKTVDVEGNCEEDKIDHNKRPLFKREAT